MKHERLFCNCGVNKMFYSYYDNKCYYGNNGIRINVKPLSSMKKLPEKVYGFNFSDCNPVLGSFDKNGVFVPINKQESFLYVDYFADNYYEALFFYTIVINDKIKRMENEIHNFRQKIPDEILAKLKKDTTVSNYNCYHNKETTNKAGTIATVTIENDELKLFTDDGKTCIPITECEDYLDWSVK